MEKHDQNCFYGTETMTGTGYDAVFGYSSLLLVSFRHFRFPHFSLSVTNKQVSAAARSCPRPLRYSNHPFV